MHRFSLRHRALFIRVPGGKRRKHRVTDSGKRPDYATRARQIHDERVQWRAALKGDPKRYKTILIVYQEIEDKLTQMAERIYPDARMEELRAKGILRELREAISYLQENDLGTELMAEIRDEVDAWVNAVKSRSPKRQR